MATRARVELRGSLTHDHEGRKFKKGSPQILTNIAEIKYYQSQAGFLVTILNEGKDSLLKQKPKQKPPATVKPEPEPEPAPTPAEPEPEPEPEPEQVSEPTPLNDYSEADLKKMKKAELQEVARELGLDDSGTVTELILTILTAK